MGYALFTARKLCLNARVNSLNAQLMSISNDRDSLTRQISAKQNANNLRNAQAKAEAASVYTKAIKDGGDKDEAKTTYEQTIADNEVEATMSNFDIAALQAQDDALDNQQKSIQTRLTAAQKELEAVEKAEESAIDHATPKYAG